MSPTIQTIEFGSGSTASSESGDESISLDTIQAKESASDSDDWSVQDHEYYVAYTPVLATGPPTPHDDKRHEYELRLGIQQSSLSRRRHLIRAYEAYKYDHFERENAEEAERFVKMARDTQLVLSQRRIYYWEAMRHTNTLSTKRKLKSEYNGFWSKHCGAFDAHGLK